MGRTSGPALVAGTHASAPAADGLRLRNGKAAGAVGALAAADVASAASSLHGIAASSGTGQDLSPLARKTLLDSIPSALANAVRPILDFKPIVTRAQLRALIASNPQIPSSSSQDGSSATGGGVLILFNRLILNPSDFLPLHPGGELALLHFVGRDAQDEIEAYHSDAALRQMASWVVGILDEADWLGPTRDGKECTAADADELERGGYVPLVPPVQLGYRAGVLEAPHAQAAALVHLPAPLSYRRPKHFPLPPVMLEPPPPLAGSGLDPARERAMSQAYRALHKRIAKDGWYVLRPAGYARECTRYAILGAVAAYFYLYGMERPSVGQAQSPLLLFLSSIFLGLFWHQLTFTAHDAGHHGITHSPLIDRLIGVTIADLIGGLSIGWWCDNHDVHHLVTNHPEHDPDIQHMPFFAISGRFVDPDAVTDGEQTQDDDNATKRPQVTFVPEGLWSSYYRRILAFDAPARVFLKYQHQLYYVVMSLGRFNLYANSYSFLAKRAWKLAFPGKSGGALGGEDASASIWAAQAGSQDALADLGEADAAMVSKLLHPRQRRSNSSSNLAAPARRRSGAKLFHLIIELSCLVVFWTWFGAGMIGSIRGWGWRVMYVLVSHIVTSPLHVQIVLSHFAQSSVDLGLFESFPSRQLRTTMDVLCPPSLDFLHGGLHMQVTHHLFPRIPRHNLRPVRDRYVRAFADEWGATQQQDGRTTSLYSEYTFGDGNRRVLGVLAEVARQVRVLGQVAEAQAKGTLHHHEPSTSHSHSHATTFVSKAGKAGARGGSSSGSSSGTDSDDA
ncbi:hypothetical protein OC834_003903 [Tilletia horrida]|nr:hypothetical protein OC834_003903 [Tilletia horrida]